MDTKTALAEYLNDHRSGAEGGVELARKLRDESTGEGEALMAWLVGEIEEDVEALDGLIDELGLERHPIKHAAGWAGEKLSRLKLNKVVTGSAELTRFLEAEALSVGIEGKRLLWVALAGLARTEPVLAGAGTDFTALAERAAGQRERLEIYRLQLAKAAVSG
jgi:hypothetical protein